MGSSDLTPPTAAAVRACGAAIGPKRRFFGTDDVVADLDLLRRALGAERWSIDGVSYGTFVAERYALAHPDARRGGWCSTRSCRTTGLDRFGGRAARGRAACSAPSAAAAPCAADLATVIRDAAHGPDSARPADAV